MAKKFLTSIDLTKNQILNVAIQNLATAPTSPVTGQIYFNTAELRMYFWDGTQWVDMSGDLQDVLGGAGLTASTANDIVTLDVNVDNATIEINADTVRVKDLGITTAKLADGAVTTVKIAANAVTFAKMQQIGANTVIGNLSGATADPSAIAVITDLATGAGTNLATAGAIKTYIDANIGGLGNLEGGWPANTGTFPVGTSPVAGTKAGDYWYVITAGTVNSVPFNVGDVIIAKVNGASTTLASDWIQLEVNRDQATTTVLGLVTLATSAEVQTGTDTSKVVTPSGLSARTATETRSGIAEIATQAEADAGTIDTHIITPLKLKTLLDNRTGGFAVNIGDGTATTFTVTHNLNTKDVVVELVEVSTGETVYADTARPTVNTITVTFAVAPTAAQFRVVVKK